MKVLAIIGDPIEQARSPAVFGDYFRLHDIAAIMVPLKVSQANFAQALGGLRLVENFAGAVVTIPHKPLAYQIASSHGPMALATGTANVLAPIGKNHWAAEMYDGIGLINALQQKHISVSGMDALLLGAGGAGTAIAVALERLGKVASIGIVDPDRHRASALAAKLETATVVEPEPEQYQLIVNASPIGMRSDQVPFEATRCQSETIVCDAVMDPDMTSLLREAENSGCVVVKGVEMLHGQLQPLVEFLKLAEPLHQTIP